MRTTAGEMKQSRRNRFVSHDKKENLVIWWKMQKDLKFCGLSSAIKGKFLIILLYCDKNCDENPSRKEIQIKEENSSNKIRRIGNL